MSSASSSPISAGKGQGGRKKGSKNKALEHAKTPEKGAERYLQLRRQLVDKVDMFNMQCNTGKEGDPVISCTAVLRKEFRNIKDGTRRMPQVMVVLPPEQLQASRNLKDDLNRAPNDGPAERAATRNTPPPPIDFNLVRSGAEARAVWTTKPGTRQVQISKKTPGIPVAKVSQSFSSPPKAAKPRSPQKSPGISPPIHKGRSVKGSNSTTPSTTHKKK
jgi:hypothetical protein